MDLPPNTEYKGHPGAIYSPVDSSEALDPIALDHGARSFTRESAAWGKVDLTRDYSAKHQFLGTFWRVILGFIINGVLWGGYAFATWYASTLGPLNKDKEHIWNVIAVGLPLLIGLHTSSVFKKMAGLMRWRVLASGYFSVKEADMILDLSSYMTCTKLSLLWFRKGRFLRALMAVSWVLFMLATQVATGLLGLVYDLDGDNALISRHGNATITRFDNYYDVLGNASGPPAQQYLAHQYGDGAFPLVSEYTTIFNSSSTSSINFNDPAPSYGDQLMYLLPASAAGSRYILRLNDWTNLTQSVGPFNSYAASSNRTVTVDTQCKKYGIVQGKNDKTARFVGPNADDISSRAGYWLQNITDTRFFEPGTVTYINNDYDYTAQTTLNTTEVDDPPLGTLSQYYCGSLRCASLGVYVFSSEAGTFDHNKVLTSLKGDFYECNVTTSQVQNAVVPGHQIADNVARLAAGSIGLNGMTTSGTIAKQQFVKYSDETVWGEFSVDATTQDVADLIGTFAIGSLAMMDQISLKDVAPGNAVYSGKRVTLKLRGEYLYAIIGVTVGIHLFMIPLLLYFANTVLIKDDSPLSLAKLLSYLVQQLGDTGNAASGDQVAEVLKDTKVRYGYTIVDKNKSLYKLELGDHVLKARKLGGFPKGSYR